MKKNILFPLLLSALTLTSCQNNKTTAYADADNMMVIDLKRADLEEMKLFDHELFYDSIKYVVLETTPQSTFAQISQVFFVEDMLVIVSKKEGAILFFDEEGNYLRKINHRGNAKFEYTTLEQVMIDEAKREVIVYDRHASKINRYDFEGKKVILVSAKLYR